MKAPISRTQAQKRIRLNEFVPYSYRQDPAVPGFPDDKPVAVLDGYCVLCARSAQFILAKDPGGLIRMTAAQSALGEALYRHYGLKCGDYDTFMLIENGGVRVKSDAALRVLEILKTWRFASWAARRFPRRIADFVYTLIARNRIRIWGARDRCFAPPPAHRGRFL
jgi:predicted DCC family thiol-disulfide oxidoreductase YuxK